MGPITLLSAAVPLLAKLFKDGEDKPKLTQAIQNAVIASTGIHDDLAGAVELLLSDKDMLDDFKGSLPSESALWALALEDTKDARSRDVELRKDGGHNIRGDILAGVAIVGLIGLIVLLLFTDLKAGPARDLIMILGGTLVALVKQVYDFEFGSSQGSKQKDRIIRGPL